MGRPPNDHSEEVVVDPETGRPLHEFVVPPIVREVTEEDLLDPDDLLPSTEPVVRSSPVRLVIANPNEKGWAQKMTDALFGVDNDA